MVSLCWQLAFHLEILGQLVFRRMSPGWFQLPVSSVWCPQKCSGRKLKATALACLIFPSYLEPMECYVSIPPVSGRLFSTLLSLFCKTKVNVNF